MDLQYFHRISLLFFLVPKFFSFLEALTLFMHIEGFKRCGVPVLLERAAMFLDGLYYPKKKQVSRWAIGDSVSLKI